LLCKPSRDLCDDFLIYSRKSLKPCNHDFSNSKLYCIHLWIKWLISQIPASNNNDKLQVRLTLDWFNKVRFFWLLFWHLRLQFVSIHLFMRFRGDYLQVIFRLHHIKFFKFFVVLFGSYSNWTFFASFWYQQ
jgi:hypothetical protein